MYSTAATRVGEWGAANFSGTCHRARPPVRRERADRMFESRRALEGRVLSNQLRSLAKV